MNRTLLILFLSLIPFVLFAQVGANQVDDFEDNTTQNWTVGNSAVAANLISTPASGGPNGVDDGYFSYVTTGNANGAGSRMIVFSRNEQWSGDFVEQDVLAIKMNVRATTGDLTLRLGFSNEPTTSVGTQIVTTTPVVIAAGSGWQSVTIPIQPSDFTTISGGTGLTPAQVLADVFEMRILSTTTTNPVLFWLGETGARRMDLDGITASTTLNTNEVISTDEFLISPNPAISSLNVHLSQDSKNAIISVYDVLGKRVYTSQEDALNTSIDVSKWNSGVYLVRISTENTTQTKRFVKQ
ncbi:T9SS type A sorting domain-containing protein [Psychroserpens sp.]|uniref:T9SS type A sorting domain-containing protein n=1 Tax=Psychroserpens sp. TaxID=2020870 RepID=UPI00385FDBA6